MKAPRIAIALTIIGSCFMLFALLMDITVEAAGERFVNLHLASQQQTLLVFGGLLFIAGIIISSTAKRSRGSYEDRDEALSAKRKEGGQSKVETQTIKERFDSLIETARSSFSIQQEHPDNRLRAGLFVGICAALFTSYLSQMLSAICLCLAILYCFRNLPTIEVVKRLHISNLIACSIVAVVLLIEKYQHSTEYQLSLSWVGWLSAIIPPLIPAVISILALRKASLNKLK